MGDNITFQNMLPQYATTPNSVDAYAAGYKSALAVRQQNALLAAGQQAANGDTNGASNTLLQSGNIDDAGKFGTLQYQMAQRRLLMAGQNALLQAAQPQQAPNPAPSPQGAPAASPAPATAADLANLPADKQQQGHALLDTFDTAAQTLAALPYGQRQAWIQQNAPALVAAGIPQAQIASFDPSDQNLAQIHAEAQQARSAMGGTPQAPLQIGGAQPAPQGAPASQAPAAPAAPFPNLRDPATTRALGAITMGGGDIKDLVALGSANLPKYTAVRPGGMMANELTGQFQGPSAPDNGTFNTPDGHGGFTNAPVAGAVGNAAAMTAGQAAAKAEVEREFGPGTAGATAGAVASAEDAHSLVTVPMPDGSTRQMTRQQAIGLAHNPSAVDLGIGSSQTPGGATYQKGQADAVNATINSDVTGREKAMADRDTALRQITTASNTPFNPTTPGLAHLANSFRALPPSIQQAAAAAIGQTPAKIDQFASKTAIYTQGSNQLLLTFARSNLPSRYAAQELNLVRPIIGQISDPNAAALVMDGIQASIANKKIARADFGQNFDVGSAPSNQAYEKQWAESPQGRAGLFQDPVWQSIKVGGKPAVQVLTHPNGSKYLAVLPGLGKPTFLPAH